MARLHRYAAPARAEQERGPDMLATPQRPQHPRPDAPSVRRTRIPPGSDRETPPSYQPSSPLPPGGAAFPHAQSSDSPSLRMHASTTAFGVARVFLLKTARITEGRRSRPGPQSSSWASASRNAQLVAPHPDGRHRPRLRHRQHLALLQQSEQIAGLDPRRFGTRRRPDLSVKARPSARAHGEHNPCRI